MAKRGRPRHPDILTPREWEVLALLREGLSNEQIAQRLDITERTAKFHVSEILSKLGVSTRQEAASWEPPERRSSWALIGAPLATLRRPSFGWAPAALMGAVVIAIGAGVGLLVWGLVRTGDEDGNRYASSSPVTLPTPTVDLSSGLDWNTGTRELRVVGIEASSWGDRATAQAYDVPLALDVRGEQFNTGRVILGLEAIPYDYVPTQVELTDGWAKFPWGWELSRRRNPLAKGFGMPRYPPFDEYFLRNRDHPGLLFRYGADVCDPSLIDPEQRQRRTFTLTDELPRIVVHREGDYISGLEAIASALRAQPDGARPV